MYAIEWTVKDKITFLTQVLFKTQSIKQAWYCMASFVCQLMQPESSEEEEKPPWDPAVSYFLN